MSSLAQSKEKPHRFAGSDLTGCNLRAYYRGSDAVFGGPFQVEGDALLLFVADENIPFVREAFGGLGDVRTMAGREMTPAAVRDAEMLLVRSVTRVNAALLSGSSVRFVGTATIGTDHVDTGWLAREGVRFAAAPGSNADSVAEYIIAALLVVAGRQGRSLAGRTLGIVGVGNVGGRVESRARALGMEVVLNDPPLARRTSEPKYRPLEELFDCDFITLHVPLEMAGADATRHLADDAFLARMQSDAVLLNSSRGAVADNAALLRALESGEIGGAILDVWEGEPEINVTLLERVALGTPHIAGYSFDGKVKGTAMLHAAACELLGTRADWDWAAVMPPAEHRLITLDAAGETVEEILRDAVLTVYAIERDDEALREIRALAPAEQGAFFDQLRKEYPRRREFPNTTVALKGWNTEAAGKLQALGFSVIDGA